MTTAVPTNVATETVAQAPPRRRASRTIPDGVAPAGRPVGSALLRVPFVIAMIAILGVGVAGVLYFNTKTDASGIRVQQAHAEVAELRLRVESLQRSVAELRSTPHLAQRARELGLVPAGDAAIMVIDQQGSPTLVGSPHSATGPDESGSDQ